MDLIGEIIEKEIEPPKVPQPVPQPDPKSFKKSRFAMRSKRPETKAVPAKATVVDNSSLSESEKIHKENVDKLAKMSEAEITQEQQELLSTLNPKLIESLMKRAEKKEKADKSHHTHDHDDHHDHQHAEGYDGWIGGMKTAEGIKDLSHLNEKEITKALGIEESNKPKKKVTFNNVATVNYEELPEDAEINEKEWEDVEDVQQLMTNSNANEIAPADYQLVNEDDEEENDEVHFPKPKTKTEEFKDLDLNDPKFYDKLHEKYYPDLPKETSKLAWMTQPMPQQRSTTYDSITDMRFDFQGNLIELKTDDDVPSYLGLHHHSENPHLPGYTLKELSHLSRSTVPGQRCLSIQMLGRILHKLGLHKYNILPIENDDETFNQSIKVVVKEFEKMMWEVVENLRIIENIQEAADEKTKNLSVRNYAIEALWLWKQGGGKPEYDEDDEISKLM
ncbi:RNA polymerase II-associated protein Rba50p [[Candida] jaroonii]|uniref:RNA polymerase II-associated protein Rba50p n=1 Tax=[Candida] jaroonii TaxID=467808 RepID=A0ACA9YBU9_9ASCO|nr:RNA polymerase II-associated protein Rba50p [[Candida] jaroonii]